VAGLARQLNVSLPDGAPSQEKSGWPPSEHKKAAREESAQKVESPANRAETHAANKMEQRISKFESQPNGESPTSNKMEHRISKFESHSNVESPTSNRVESPASKLEHRLSRFENQANKENHGSNKVESPANARSQSPPKEQPASTKREGRKSFAFGGGSPTGNADCDISSPAIKEAYEQVRDDEAPTNWMLMGYGSNKKALELYGSGTGGLEEFATKLKEDEVTYGYVRVIYGDSQRSKFVFVTYVPEGLSGMNKAKANMHKPAVIAFVQYMHIEVYASTTAELDEPLIQAKLKAAAGANYGTGGEAPAGSEDFGSVKDNAKNFFQQTESKGNRQSIVYHKGPLAETTPVALQGRAGITEKYIKT